MTKKEFEEKGIRLFGEDKMKWEFRCPWCKQVFQVSDWKRVGAPENAIAFNCVGRYQKKSKCNYTGGGLFKMNPMEVDGNYFFEFAKVEENLNGL